MKYSCTVRRAVHQHTDDCQRSLSRVVGNSPIQCTAESSTTCSLHCWWSGVHWV